MVGHSPCNIGKPANIDRYVSASAFCQEVTLTSPITFLSCHSEATLAALIGIFYDFGLTVDSWGKGIWNNGIDYASRDE